MKLGRIGCDVGEYLSFCVNVHGHHPLFPLSKMECICVTGGRTASPHFFSPTLRARSHINKYLQIISWCGAFTGARIHCGVTCDEFKAKGINEINSVR